MINSIRSLRGYNPEIDILIINTGAHFSLPETFQPVKQIKLQGLFNRFPDDKYLIGALESHQNLIYLDSDTFLSADVARLFDYAMENDLAARLSWTYQSSRWTEAYFPIWKLNLELVGAPYVPVFNSGVIVFKNYAHVRIFTAWRSLIAQFLAGELKPVYGGPRLFEQLAFSAAVGKVGLSYIPLDKNAHSYAWNHELSSGTIVYHTTSKWYEQYKLHIDEPGGMIS